MADYTFLAFDLGATSGRAIVGNLDDNSLKIEEIHRFDNTILQINGKHYWDIYNLYNQLITGIKKCAEAGIKPHSIGIDTWGVDCGYIGADGTLLALPRSYRDPYTQGVTEEFFKIIPREELYGETGIQIMDFNTIFQMYKCVKEGYSPLLSAEKALFMPDLLSYLLTGNMVCEYTDASTSQLLDPKKREFSKNLLNTIGVKEDIFPEIVMPGSRVGKLSEHISNITGMDRIDVIAVAGHDTASAVAAVPSPDENFAYLSSGTWSLMGIEVENPIINEESMKENFTNEGGIEGTTRFLKNITGMWLLEECRRSWKRKGRDYSYNDIVEMALSQEDFTTTINPDDQSFAAPDDMPTAIIEYCEKNGLKSPSNDSEMVKCIFTSLAQRYKDVLEILKRFSPNPIDRLHIISGGCKNALLNQMTADAIGIPVVAGPSEATAIGNIMIQAKAAGIVSDRKEMRRLIAQAIETQTFTPRK